MADKNLARERILEGYDPETGEVDAAEWLKSAYMGLMAPRQKEAYLEGRDPSLSDYIGDALFASLNFTPMGPVGTKALGFFASKAPKIAKALSKAPKGIKAIFDAALAPAAENAYDFANYDDGRGSIENVGTNMSLETALNILTPKVIKKIVGSNVYDNPQDLNRKIIEEAEKEVRDKFDKVAGGEKDFFINDARNLDILKLDELKKSGFFDKALYGIEKINKDMPWTEAYKIGASINNPAYELLEKDILKDFGVDEVWQNPYPLGLIGEPFKIKSGLVSIKESEPLIDEMVSEARSKYGNSSSIDEAKKLFSRNMTPEEVKRIIDENIKYGEPPVYGDASTLSRYGMSSFDDVLDKLARDPELARIMYVPYDYRAKDAAKYGIFSGLNKKFNDYLVEDYFEEDEDIEK